MSRRPIPGYEGIYSVDKMGNIFREERLVKREKHPRGVFCRLRLRKLQGHKERGYKRVNLVDKDGNCKKWSVHRLVALVFLGLNLNLKQPVDHKNRKRDDNRVTNLVVTTTKENLKNRGFSGICKHCGMINSIKRVSPYFLK